MLTVYTRTNCAYSAMVIHELEELGLSFEEKDIGDSAIAQELLERGGRVEVPYLIDTEAGVELYGSAGIVAHLLSKYADDIPHEHLQ